MTEQNIADMLLDEFIFRCWKKEILSFRDADWILNFCNDLINEKNRSSLGKVNKDG